MYLSPSLGEYSTNGVYAVHWLQNKAFENYTHMIDDGRGEEVAAAIESLLVPWYVDLWNTIKRKVKRWAVS